MQRERMNETLMHVFDPTRLEERKSNLVSKARSYVDIKFRLNSLKLRRKIASFTTQLGIKTHL